MSASGSLSRITNWEQMSEREREVARRRIAKRNKERLDALRADADGTGTATDE